MAKVWSLRWGEGVFIFIDFGHQDARRTPCVMACFDLDDELSYRFEKGLTGTIRGAGAEIYVSGV